MDEISPPERSGPETHARRVGDITVTAIADGVHPVSFDNFLGVDRRLCEEAYGVNAGNQQPWVTINAYLIQTGNRTMLVDSGFGAETPFVGNLVRNLATLGVGPQSIDTILMTHLHPDHEAGLVDAAGHTVFANAELILADAEYAYWMDDGAMARTPLERQVDFVRARAAVGAYRGRVRRIGSDAEVGAGVRSLATPGHTPGHTAWLIESGGDAMLVWGDIMNLPAVQFAYPEAGVIFDVDTAAAVSTRRAVLDMAAADTIAVAGIHLDFPAIGHVKAVGRSYAFVPDAW